jgi:hypothetical protein
MKGMDKWLLEHFLPLAWVFHVGATCWDVKRCCCCFVVAFMFLIAIGVLVAEENVTRHTHTRIDPPT